MAIILGDNIRISGPLPIDSRYFNNLVPYTGITHVNSVIPEAERHIGLTVVVKTGSTYSEYWYRTGVTNSSLELKTRDIAIPTGSFITGGTNIGYFCGFSGVQILPIDNIADNNYDGNYRSLYNYFYRDTDAVIRTGAPNGCTERRGYYNCLKDKSWIWNNRVCGSECIGWIFVDGNVENLLGTCPSVATYYPPSAPYSAITWTTGSFYNNGSNTVVNTVVGSLSTGSTLCIGGRPLGCAAHNNLHFRTVISDTPNLLAVRDDESFIRLSGRTSVLSATNVGTGAEVLSGQTATELFFRRISGSGNTQVTTVGNSVVIYTSLSGGTTYVTGATNIGSSGGTGVFDSKNNVTLQFRNLVGSGDTSVSLSGDSIVIYTDAGEDTYNLSSPAAICVGGICVGTPLIGKTAFELFEELLVPELFPNFPFTAPSTTTTLYSGVNVIPNNALYEIGCPIGVITVCSSFSRGAITPQYCSASPFRSGNANCYVFTGTDVSGSYAVTGTSMSCNTLSYTILQGSVNTWGTNTCYDAGVQPKGSKGTDFCTPLSAGQTSTSNRTIIGAYPLFGTCVNLTTLTCVHLCNMATANCVQITLVPEDGVNKQKFEIPCAWLTSRPLVGVQDYNCLNGCWEYGSGGLCGLNYYCSCSVNKTIQGNSINYAQYSHCCGTRGIACIRLIF